MKPNDNYDDASQDRGPNQDQDQDQDLDDENPKSNSEFAAMLEESFKKKAKRYSVGDKVKGEVLVVGKEDVFVSIGSAKDGVVPRRELSDPSGMATCKVGDVLDLYVTVVRGSEIFLSPNPTSKNLADDLEDAFDMMLPVDGRVAEVCKGGFRVSIMGKLAFCPISQMDLKFVEQPDEYVGKRFEFKITQFSEGGRNIVVSRRKLLEEQQETSAATFSQERKVGDVIPGRVSRLEKFGAFVEIAPGVDGLLHVSELAWSRVGDPSEVVQPGQEVSVKIIKIEGGGGEKLKISLSLKQVGDKPESVGQSQAGSLAQSLAANDPWMKIAEKYPVGAVVSGKVERKASYGLFVSLDGAVTGLLPKSKAAENPDFPFAKLKIGDPVTVQIAEVRPSERRISLSPPGEDNGEADWKSYSGKAASTSGTSMGTLGGAFGDKLKASLEKKKK